MERLQMYVELEELHNKHFPNDSFHGYRDLLAEAATNPQILQVEILSTLCGLPSICSELMDHEVLPKLMQGDEQYLWDRVVAAVMWDYVGENATYLYRLAHSTDDGSTVNNVTPAQLRVRERAFRYLVKNHATLAPRFMNRMQVTGPIVGTCGYVEMQVTIDSNMRGTLKNVSRHNVGLAQIRPSENLPPAFLRAAMAYDLEQHVILVIRNVDVQEQCSVFVMDKHLIVIDPLTQQVFANQ
jgi:hypothetical protein